MATIGSSPVSTVLRKSSFHDVPPVRAPRSNDPRETQTTIPESPQGEEMLKRTRTANGEYLPNDRFSWVGDRVVGLPSIRLDSRGRLKDTLHTGHLSKKLSATDCKECNAQTVPRKAPLPSPINPRKGQGCFRISACSRPGGRGNLSRHYCVRHKMPSAIPARSKASQPPSSPSIPQERQLLRLVCHVSRKLKKERNTTNCAKMGVGGPALVR